jgi:hypothetical protein
MPRKRSVTVAELQHLRRVLDEVEAEGNENLFALAAIRLLMMTGACKDDILKALRCNIDMHRRVLALEDSKTGRRRVDIGLNRAATDIIASARSQASILSSRRSRGRAFVLAPGLPMSAFTICGTAWRACSQSVCRSSHV